MKNKDGETVYLHPSVVLVTAADALYIRLICIEKYGDANKGIYEVQSCVFVKYRHFLLQLFMIRRVYAHVNCMHIFCSLIVVKRSKGGRK